MSSPKLSPAPGSKKGRKRVGRGVGSGRGKTAGRGMKGQGSRSGSKKRAWFEGGQMPLQRRLPKVGFVPHRRTRYQTVNLSSFAKAESGATFGPAELAARGWIKDPEGPIKILGDGDLGPPLHIRAHKFSRSAAQKVEKAGGTVTILPLHHPAAAGPNATTTDES